MNDVCNQTEQFHKRFVELGLWWIRMYVDKSHWKQEEGEHDNQRSKKDSSDNQSVIHLTGSLQCDLSPTGHNLSVLVAATYELNI